MSHINTSQTSGTVIELLKTYRDGKIIFNSLGPLNFFIRTELLILYNIKALCILYKTLGNLTLRNFRIRSQSRISSPLPNWSLRACKKTRINVIYNLVSLTKVIYADNTAISIHLTLTSRSITLITRCLTLISRYLTLISSCLTLIIRCLTLISRWLTLITRCLTLITRCLTLFTRCLTLITRCLILITRCLTHSSRLQFHIIV